jgi:hypothetical protein
MEGMGPNRIWNPANERQETFLNQYFSACRNEAVLIPEIKSLASKSAAEINRFLAENGFTIKLKEFESQEFGVASILDLLLKWAISGEKKDIRYLGAGKVYPGIRIASHNAKFYESVGHPYPIAELITKSDDQVFITIAPGEPANEFHLMAMIAQIDATIKESYKNFAGVHLPMVDLQEKMDISWILGMYTKGIDGRTAYISQAAMEGIAKLNEVGIRVKIAVANGVMRGMAPTKKDLEIDRPFLLWIKRPGLRYPLAILYVDRENGKNPGDITG